MIVKSIPEGWEVIYQRAHGLLAAQLAHHWKVPDRPPYWTHTLIAIAEHDDGLPESRAPENLTEAGAPRHFQLFKYSPTQYRNVMEIAASKSRWNALLISMHLTFLYGDEVQDDPELAIFIQSQRELQKRLLRELNLTRTVADRAYRFVQWCDALSLLLCMNKVQPEQRRMEVSKGPDGTVHQLWQDQQGTLRIDPWPFASRSFAVEVEYRQLRQLQFESTQELHEALTGAAVQVRTWNFGRSSLGRVPAE
jgi:broad specificity phosphatase PhoE